MKKNTQHTSHSARNIALFFVAALLFGSGVMVGMARDLNEDLYDEEGNVEISRVVDLRGKTRSEEISFDQYWDIWDKIKARHVSQPVDEVSLFYGSLEGLVSGLDDPYSIYFPPQKAKEFTRDLSGEFEGIGAEIGLRDEQITVIAPLPGSPAEQAGLKPGSKIFAIDGEDIAGLSLEEVVLKIRGKRGTEVTITVTSNGFDTLEDIVIVRDTINVPTVLWEKKENGIVYLRVSYLNESTWMEFDKAVKEILLESPQGLVFDLRSNPGGYLDTSVRIAAEWVEEGAIVLERFNDGSEETYTAEQGRHRFVGIPTVTLIDQGAASGSEIIAGALQDHNLATVIGQTTFGKGSVQEFEILPDGSALKLTVAKWFTPHGRQIDEKGVEPDEIIEEMFIQIEGTEGLSEDDYIDKGVERALEILLK
ncbi:peptidase S41 [Candidatus Parcubacteria bacterium]|nr:MAG: peptidase S41 [Candidatus Parcubacteria bacterium]